jgi:hypothetical protein
MTPPGSTTDPAVLAAEERLSAAMAEHKRLARLFIGGIDEARDAGIALREARAAAWASAELPYEVAKAWLAAHPDEPTEQVPMGVIKAALRAHRRTS